MAVVHKTEEPAAAPERRIKAVRVSAEVILEMMVSGRAFRCVDSEIPEGARVVGAGFDVRSDAFQITFEHPSFEKVFPGCPTPLVAPPFMRREA